MDDIWTILIMIAVAVPVFLLVRWLAARRAVSLAQRRRRSDGRQSDGPRSR